MPEHSKLIERIIVGDMCHRRQSSGYRATARHALSGSPGRGLCGGAVGAFPHPEVVAVGVNKTLDRATEAARQWRVTFVSVYLRDLAWQRVK